MLGMDVAADSLIDEPTLLKALLKARHWQKRDTFARQWDKIAKTIDPRLVGCCPGHAQFCRWLSGSIRGTPYPDACIILEVMFPGWTVNQLFQPVQTSRSTLLRALTAKSDNNEDMATLTHRLLDPGLPRGSGNLASGETPGTCEREVSEKLALLAQDLKMSKRELEDLTRLTGRIVELDTAVTIDISENGHAVVEFDRLILNLMDRPVASLSWGTWFERAYEKVSVRVNGSCSRNTKIAVKHGVANHVKFATLASPSLSLGDTARISYSCHGGLFTDNLYWRKSISRDVRHFSLTVRQHASDELLRCSATEELPDGSERSAMEDLTWDTRDGCHTIRVTRDYLERNQAVTIRWELDR
jgi:hypothetical protein